MSNNGERSGSSGTNVQPDDEDVIIIEPEIPVIDLCTPCIETNKWSRLEGFWNRNPQLVATPKSANNFRDKPPVAKAENVPSKSNDVKCAICLLSPLDRKPHATRCGHVFCLQCIKRSLIVKKECPLCKAYTCTSLIIPLHI